MPTTSTNIFNTMVAKIYKPSKSAMQSGRANVNCWLLEFEPENTRYIEPLMRWTGNSDTKQQLRMKFHAQEEAEKYAKSKRIEYVVIEPKKPKLIKQAYADNFTKK